MKKQIAIASMLATLVLGAGAGIVVAQSTANPSSDVLFNSSQPVSAYDQPTNYAEGVTISEMNVQWNPGCNGYGLATTTRIADRVVQEVVITESYESNVEVGDVCTRTGTVSDGYFPQFTNQSGS